MDYQQLVIYQVDAFTATAFGGNPAAVCLLPCSVLPLDDRVRQQIAAEMNLSETAFLECLEDGKDFHQCSSFRLRWFTPLVEVPLCGHATLAAAAALFQGEASPASMLRFETQSGELRVRAEPGGGGAGTVGVPLLCMDFPCAPIVADIPAGTGPGSELIRALVGDRAVEVVLFAPSLKYLLVVLESGGQEGPPASEALLSLRPDFQRMAAAHSMGQVAGVIITAPGCAGGPHDFCSRFFGPWLGVPEDPVTGSAHCLLGPFWAARLGKLQLRARQCSARGGELRVTVDESKGRVEIAGQAVLVLKGNLLLPRSQ